MIMNDIFKLSTSSKQTYRKRERNRSNRMVSAHSHSHHLLTLPSSESKGPKSGGRAGRSIFVVKSYFHVIGHFWKEALWWPALNTCRFPTSPTQEVILESHLHEFLLWGQEAGELKPSSREWCHLDWTMNLVTCSPSWCCCSLSAGIQVIREPKRKKGE